MTLEGKYIYGFISTGKSENLGSIGIDKGEVCSIPYQDIAALVSDLPFIQFDFLSKETLLHNLAIYQSVIEKVMKSYHIIPMKFGTVVQGEEEVKRVLENGYDQINKNLKEMENKIELDVAALWSNFETVLKEIGAEEGVKTLKEEASSKSPDQIFQIKIKVGKLVKGSLDKKREKCASEILDTLKREADYYYVNSIMDDSMIMNTAFLIDRDKIETFESKVDGLDRHYQDSINFRIVGPLPPYSFSTFEVKKAEFTEVNEAREILGLGEESTPLEIKDTYRELSKKFHPDKYLGDQEAQKRFEKIIKAYQMLSNYCQEDYCSFREPNVREWVAVRPLEQSGTFV